MGGDYVDFKSKLILGSIHTCVIGVHDLRIWPLKSLGWKVFNNCDFQGYCSQLLTHNQIFQANYLVLHYIDFMIIW